MKTWIAKILLKLTVWLFDYVYTAIDTDKDGKISKKELFDAADYLDKATSRLIYRFK